MKIIDDDEHGNQTNDIDESELFALNEEAPQIVGMIDERAPEVMMRQEYIESGKWKKIGESAKAPAEKRKTRSVSEDASPPRREKSPNRRKSASSDISPPRARRGSSNMSPPPRNNSSDMSPPRRNLRKVQNSDLAASNFRGRRRSSDNSPPRRTIITEKTRHRRDSDASPPRRSKRSPEIKRQRSNDRSPQPRRKSNTPPRRRSRWSPEIKREPASPRGRKSRDKDSSAPHTSKMTKTLDGKASGLQDAKTLKRENDEHNKRQEKLFQEMNPEMSGRDAEVTIRDRRGRNKEFEKELENEKQKAEFEAARKKEYDRWGKGLKQIEDIEKRWQEHVHEASKPLARAADDEDLQDHLKNQERLDDPMLEYFRKKKQDDNRKKGVQEKPKYVGQFADNRYNIPPGFRWDGVDRSNGYEKKYFSMINSKKSLEEEAYRYSTEDM